VANKQITTQDLDFDKIKSNLKTFLQGQTDLSDYNFEGSGLSLLLDVLAYNTHYNNLYLNLAVNESFLDSAVIRNSVVSKAFELGYLPKSATSAKAVVNITLTNVSGNPGIVSIPSLTAFNTTVNGSNFSFYNMEPSVATSVNGIYKFSDLVITEGTPLTQTYTVSDNTTYTISNTNVDISTISVDVYDSLNSTTKVKYTRSTDILNVTATDTVFFLKEIEGGKYEVQFGNDRIGKSVSPGNIVVINYFVSKKATANGARLFTSPNLSTNATIVTLYQSQGGSDMESIDDIKFNAPRLFNSTNRAVTAEDYRSLLLARFPNIASINVWGGEDNLPPVYGSVFISILPKSNSVLTSTEKDVIVNDILKSRKMVTITPKFVDPFYLNIRLTTAIYYDPNNTSKTANELSVIATNAILDYNTANLRQFDSVLRYSKLIAAIDNSDSAITGNITTLVVDRNLSVKFNVNTNYTFHIDNPIYSAGVPEDAVTSNGFYVFGDSTNVQYLKDDGYGIIQRYYIDPISLKPVVTNTNQGTVDYSIGKISLTNFHITRLASNYMALTFKLQSNDVVSVRDHVVNIDPSLLTVTAIPESANSGLVHTFTASR
jgi:hypothetical protein